MARQRDYRAENRSLTEKAQSEGWSSRSAKDRGRAAARADLDAMNVDYTRGDVTEYSEFMRDFEPGTMSRDEIMDWYLDFFGEDEFDEDEFYAWLRAEVYGKKK